MTHKERGQPAGQPNCFTLALNFFSNAVPGLRSHNGKWPADSLATWYAVAHRKLEELAYMYSNQISLMFLNRGYGTKRTAEKFEELLERHAEANECLRTLGYAPQLLKGVDPTLLGLDPATAASRPANLPTGVANTALTRNDLLARFRAGDRSCTVVDAAC